MSKPFTRTALATSLLIAGLFMLGWLGFRRGRVSA